MKYAMIHDSDKFSNHIRSSLNFGIHYRFHQIPVSVDDVFID